MKRIWEKHLYNGDSLEEAEEKASKQTFDTNVKVEITYLDEDFTLEIPEVSEK